MEFIRSKATRTRVSEAFYIASNVLLAVALLLLARFELPYLALLLVLLSKWRIFALRPRYWWVTIKANLVDILVGVSTVALLYLSSSEPVLQVLLALLYGGWLLVIKPRSGLSGVALQAGIAQFVGLVALFHFSVILPEIVVILGCWFIGYTACRHVVSSYEEKHVELLSALWGLMLAELGWLLYHWTTVYNIGLPLRLPQIALIMLVLGFCGTRMYHAHKQDRLTPGLLRGTALFGAILLAVLVLFSPWDVTV